MADKDGNNFDRTIYLGPGVPPGLLLSLGGGSAVQVTAEMLAVATQAAQDRCTFESAAKMINHGLTAEHSGDCTKQPWTCMVCFRETVLREADEVIAAFIQQAQEARDA